MARQCVLFGRYRALGAGGLSPSIKRLFFALDKNKALGRSVLAGRQQRLGLRGRFVEPVDVAHAALVNDKLARQRASCLQWRPAHASCSRMRDYLEFVASHDIENSFAQC